MQVCPARRYSNAGKSLSIHRWLRAIYSIELEHPEAGTIRQTRPAARFSKSNPELRNGAPALGADTDAILAEINIPDDMINKLKNNGTIA